MMIKYIILGIIQGITEVLPISSSAHLLFFSELLNEDISLSFEITLHFASLLAIIIFERKKIKKLILHFFLYLKTKDERYKKGCLQVFYLSLATIPLVIVTLLIKPWIEIINTNLFFVSIFLIINAIMLTFTNRFADEAINHKNSIIIGLTQSISIFSGISRSGSCLFGGSVCKLDKKEAIDFAFLLFLPVCFGAICYDLLFTKEFVFTKEVVISFVFAFVFTFLSLKCLFIIIKKERINYFSVYSFLFSVAMFLLYLKRGN